MINFVAIERSTWDKDGASLPVLKWQMVQDGRVLAELESWADIKPIDSDKAVLTIGFAPTLIIELGPEELRAIGFRPSMISKEPR